MTREEQIRQAALAYSFDTDGGHSGDLNAGRDDFIEGAKWADEHPAWELIAKIWNLATKTAISQCNKEMGEFNSEKEIKNFIKKKIKL